MNVHPVDTCNKEATAVIALATPPEEAPMIPTRRLAPSAPAREPVSPPVPIGLARRLDRVGLPRETKLVSYAVDPDGTAEAAVRVGDEVHPMDAGDAAYVWGRG
jgi:hypothetical protein